MEQDDLTINDYHTLDRAGQVICLHTGHNRLNSHMNRRVNLVPSPTTLFRARTGTLKLNIERRHTDGYTNCENM